MRVLLACLLWFGAVMAHAAIDVYDFASPAEEQRYRQLLDELRCPKCQNQSLAGSDAGVAKDLKDRTYQLMQQGHSDDEIRAYLIERYGDFITYRPPLRASTLVLWVGPFVLLLVAAIIVVWRVRRRPAAVTPISAEEQARLARLLADREEDK
ncbi:MAG: cytochrome c-type biogenesis protein CcmH [Moraxellaceae bacterium]